ncbi:1-acyl-sn-glycerol-3-phosphate acyltransferase [Taibaiella sp. KBW10]|uniref:lysophospholipid acyltransferase family protein n=1 Tax=Taibaiella sp. KBW10 TaxID=2153357 RepID=UPI000F5A7325|nr:lysophospholipid acyltransferase family protein [Taibaiella sp. KBW10]RQO30905.1 1-acyl-sn-glycerol-3-phosphate acyltransferase [Taibaiella sp. KBW10]
MKYIYVLYALLTFILFFLALLPFFFILSLFGAWGRKAIWRLVQGWSYVWFFLLGMRTRKIFEAPLDKNEEYIVVVNHISYIDVPIIFRAIPFFVRPLAKFELGKIPLFGFLYRQLAVTIDRANGKSKLEGSKQLKNTLEEGSSILIFPEGTFNETGAPLKSFYDGAFRIALETQTPILPVVFLDALDIWNYKSFWSLKPGKNRVVFLPKVAVAPYGTDVKRLSAEVHRQMWDTINEYKKLP